MLYLQRDGRLLKIGTLWHKAHICSLVFHNVWLTNDILLGIVGFSSLGVFGDEGLVLDRINKIKMTAVVVEWRGRKQIQNVVV